MTAMTTKTGKSTKRSPKRQAGTTSSEPNLNLNSQQRQLFNEHERMVNLAAVKYGCGRHRENRDEIAQEARIALAKAIKSYDAGRSVPFEAYAWKCIRNRSIDFLKRRSQPPSHDNLTSGADEETGEPMTLFEKVEARIARRELQSRGEHNYEERIDQVRYAVENSLTGMERRAFKLYYLNEAEDDKTLDEIAKKLKTSKTATQRALQHALAKLRKRLIK
jgi:RNA polymerase sigma factor (sigma-70 family)